MILSQNNKIPQSVVSNGFITGNTVQNPNNLLNTTDSTALFSPTSDVILGNFAFNIPLDAVIVGIKGVIRAQITNNSIPAGSLTPIMVDGINYYPGTPVTGISAVLDDYTIGGEYDVWGNVSWTPTKINNLTMGIVSDSSIEGAWASLTVYYYIPQTSLVPPPFGLPGCPDCDSEIQALPFELAEPWLSNQDKLILKSFNLPDENLTPITMDMIGDCGGSINLTVDPDLRPEDGGNFIENFNLVSGISSITNLPNGLVQLDLGDITLRGLGFTTPYGHSTARISEHAVGAVVIITNNGPWNSKLLKRCHIGTLVSEPIKTLDEGNTVVYPTVNYNFKGPNVQAEQDSINLNQANITINSNPNTVTPTEEDHNEGTTGTTPSTTLSIPLTIVAANYLRVWISAQIENIVSVTYDGVPMGIVTSKQNPSNDSQSLLFDLVNPNIGAHNIVVTFANAINFSAGANSYLDVDTINPIDGIGIGSFGTSNNPTDSVVTTYEGTLVQSVVATTTNPTNFTQYGLWTVNGQVNIASRPGAVSTRMALSPGNIPNTYGLSTITPWSMIMAGIKGINSSSTGVQSVTGLDTDNTDPANPIVKIAVDGTTITGLGTPSSPLVATGGGSGSGTAIVETVSQTSHGFTTGQAVRSSYVSGQYTLAQADTGDNSAVIGIVSDVVDANTFKITKIGEMTLTTGFPIGDSLWLSATIPGLITNVEPTVNGQVAQPLGYVVATNAIDVKIQRGNDIGTINSTVGTVSSRLIGSYFQDFNNDIAINSSPANTIYGGLYPWGLSSSGMTATNEVNHPGVLDIATTSGGPANIGIGIIGLDVADLTVEFMISMSNAGSQLSLELPFGNTTSLKFECIAPTSDIIVNGTTLSATYTVGGWDVIKVVYNSTGTSVSVYFNNVLLSSSVPVSVASSFSPGMIGYQSKCDYVSINGAITR